MEVKCRGMRAKGGGQRKTKTLEVSLFSVTALSFSNNMIVFREGIYFLGPQPHLRPSVLSRINSVVTVLRNRLVWPGWSAKIIHKNIVIFKNTTYIINRRMFCLVCAGYIFHVAICQLRHQYSDINKHN